VTHWECGFDILENSDPLSLTLDLLEYLNAGRDGYAIGIPLPTFREARAKTLRQLSAGQIDPEDAFNALADHLTRLPGRRIKSRSTHRTLD
jgi:hypothetical protein